MRILGLDYGEKRIGMAISDPLGFTAQTLEVYERKNKKADFAHIKEIVESYDVEKIVVGFPLNMNGTIGSKAEEVLLFIAELEKRIDLSIEKWDERLSSAQSERLLIEANMSRKKRKKVIDKIAANYILQSYLDCYGNG